MGIGKVAAECVLASAISEVVTPDYLPPQELEENPVKLGGATVEATLDSRYDAPNLATALSARQALSASGHTVEYIEVAEGHNATTWRNHLRDVLVSLFGSRDALPGKM